MLMRMSWEDSDYILIEKHDMFCLFKLESCASEGRQVEMEEFADVMFEGLQRARSDGSGLVYRKVNADNKGGRANNIRRC